MSQSRSFSRPAPLVNIAAIAVILASLAAIGAVTGLIPSPVSRTDESPAAPDVKPAAVGETCRQCGVIETLRQVQIKDQGAVLGSAGGTIVGSQFGRGNSRYVPGAAEIWGGANAGNEVEASEHPSIGYRLVVRMDDGSVRTVYQSAAPGFVVGEKVSVINGAVAARR